VRAARTVMESCSGVTDQAYRDGRAPFFLVMCGRPLASDLLATE
jgi:hypothetical protein